MPKWQGGFFKTEKWGQKWVLFLWSCYEERHDKAERIKLYDKKPSYGECTESVEALQYGE